MTNKQKYTSVDPIYMGAEIIMATGKVVNVCTYKYSDTPEIPTESLESDGRWIHYARQNGHWEKVNVCKYKTSDTRRFQNNHKNQIGVGIMATGKNVNVCKY